MKHDCSGAWKTFSSLQAPPYEGTDLSAQVQLPCGDISQVANAQPAEPNSHRPGIYRRRGHPRQHSKPEVIDKNRDMVHNPGQRDVAAGHHGHTVQRKIGANTGAAGGALCWYGSSAMKTPNSFVLSCRVGHHNLNRLPYRRPVLAGHESVEARMTAGVSGGAATKIPVLSAPPLRWIQLHHAFC